MFQACNDPSPEPASCGHKIHFLHKIEERERERAKKEVIHYRNCKHGHDTDFHFSGGRCWGDKQPTKHGHDTSHKYKGIVVSCVTWGLMTSQQLLGRLLTKILPL